MSEKRTIHLDFDRLIEVLRKGVRRADVFLGVGLNAATHQPPISHVLPSEGGLQIQLTKEELNAAEKEHVSHEFGKWIVANGLRELLDTFSNFMSRLYIFLYLLRRDGVQNGADQLCSPRRFERMGIGEKLKTLSAFIDVSPEAQQIIESLNGARNCFVHRFGMIGPSDIEDASKEFVLRWNVIQIEVQEPSGNVVEGDEIFSKVFEKGGDVLGRIVGRSKTYKLGEELVLDKGEVREICLYVYILGHGLFRGAVGLAREAGVLKESDDPTYI